MGNSINYKPSATINDVLAPVILTAKKGHQCSIVPLPGQSIHTGDLVCADGNRWIVTKVSLTNPIQTVANGLLCNHLFRFQIFSSEIIERWGVLDGGSYSIDNDDQITVINRECKIYLPRDSQTEKLYVNKRFAIDVIYDQHGDKQLLTYQIIGIDPASQNFDPNGHLLIYKVMSAPFVENSDNISEMICDYIAPGGVAPTPTKTMNCAITGKSKLRTGMSNTYKAVFYAEDGATQVSSVTPVWNTSSLVSGLTASQSSGSLVITAENKDSLVGEKITITLSDAGGSYNPQSISVEVV